jgi:enamine deaminase RidA (YjgF/YER057c/UK114 family)
MATTPKNRRSGALREAGELIALWGYADDALDGRQSRSLAQQLQSIVEYLTDDLNAVGAQLHHLVKIVVYHALPVSEEGQVREALGYALGTDVEVVCTLVPLRALSMKGQLAQVNAIAMRERARTSVTLLELAALPHAFCHGLRCGSFSFTSGESASSANDVIRHPQDLVGQNRCMLDNVHHILEALEVSLESVVKGNSWRAADPAPQAYLQAANDRFDFFRSSRAAVTGITVPGLSPDGWMTRLDVWAMDGRLPRQSHKPADHWDWAIDVPYSHGLQAGRWLFVGGQGALDADCAVQLPDDVVGQTRMTMEFVERIVIEAGGELRDMVAAAGYICAGEGSEVFAEVAAEMRRRHADTPSSGAQLSQVPPSEDPSSSLPLSFASPSLASFSSAPFSLALVPVDDLAYSRQVVEIEAIAYLDSEHLM